MNPFQVTRHNEPILSVRVNHSVDPDIDYSLEFLGYQAAIAAGATLEELYKWDKGEYSHTFMGRVIARYVLNSAIISHQEDASADKQENA